MGWCSHLDKNSSQWDGTSGTSTNRWHDSPIILPSEMPRSVLRGHAAFPFCADLGIFNFFLHYCPQTWCQPPGHHFEVQASTHTRGCWAWGRGMGGGARMFKPLYYLSYWNCEHMVTTNCHILPQLEHWWADFSCCCFLNKNIKEKQALCLN